MGWEKDKVFQTGEDFIEWLDKEYGAYVKSNISSLDVHHTWKPNHSNYPANTTLQLHKNIRNFHINKNGWSDIGQHVTIGKEGNVVLGLPIEKTPASSVGQNGSSSWHPFMFEMIGDFDKGQDKLQGAQLASVLSISRYFHKKKGKPVRFHREMASYKSCPGTGLDKKEFMSWVNAQPKKEEEDMLEKAIVINGFPDFAFAESLANRLQAPIYTRAALGKRKVSKELYVVGGSPEGLQADKIIPLTGKDRYEVAAAVKKFLG